MMRERRHSRDPVGKDTAMMASITDAWLPLEAG
jgi:hypothetical protein